MAKFRLRASVIPALEARNVIKGDGKMKVRIPSKDKPITGEHCFELLVSSTDVVETSNAYAIKVISGVRGPKIRLGSGWFITDPAISWFEQVDDSTPTTIQLESATEILTHKDRELLRRYANDTGIEVASPVTKAENANLLPAARAHFRNH